MPLPLPTSVAMSVFGTERGWSVVYPGCSREACTLVYIPYHGTRVHREEATYLPTHHGRHIHHPEVHTPTMGGIRTTLRYIPTMGGWHHSAQSASLPLRRLGCLSAQRALLFFQEAEVPLCAEDSSLLSGRLRYLSAQRTLFSPQGG